MRAIFFATLSVAFLAPAYAGTLDCADPQTSGNKFTMACKGPKISLSISGPYDGDNANPTMLSVAPEGGSRQNFTLQNETSSQDDIMSGGVSFGALQNTVALLDLDFDGHPDLQIPITSSAGPNMGFVYLLYDPKTKGFQMTKLGEQLFGFGVAPDPKTKTIAVSARSSCCASTDSVFGWSGARLILRQSRDSDSFPAAYLPGMKGSSTVCGDRTVYRNEAGLMTAMDVALKSEKDFDPKGQNLCTRSGLKAQGKFLAKIQAKPKGYSVQVKDAYHFTLTFTPPRHAE